MPTATDLRPRLARDPAAFALQGPRFAAVG
jgi:hypothetical protein